MTSTAKKLLDVALSLPEEDRRRLGQAILDSVSGVYSSEIEQAWVAEALRRAEEVEQGKGKLIDLDEALRKLRADLTRL